MIRIGGATKLRTDRIMTRGMKQIIERNTATVKSEPEKRGKKEENVIMLSKYLYNSI
jgi:hypothetical protein